jgi:hypothetical protein
MSEPYLAATPQPPGPSYHVRWWIMVVGWLLGLASGAIGIMEKVGWSNLGISDMTANWLLVIAGVCVLISGAIATLPTYPDSARVRAENAIHWDRKLHKHNKT